MRRREFLAGSFGALGMAMVPLSARASGGLDLDSPVAASDLRIFLGRESARRYRGRLANIALPDGRSGLVNTLSIEEYLYGVVPMEMPSSWPYAALEAQAILARTFAVRKRNALHPYDLVAGTADQEYGGITAEALASTAAVDACTGLIVTYDGQPASIAYMSACGGHTDDAARVWGGNVPYMTGVPCTFCADAPSARWTQSLAWGDIARAAGLDANPPHAVRLTEFGPGGRPGAVVFSTSRGDERIDIAKLREASGYRLPSTFVHEIAIEGADARFGASGARAVPAGVDSSSESAANGTAQSAPASTVSAPALPPELAEVAYDDDRSVRITCTGSGSGHGVGVCQWGARGMAAAGYTAQAIVAYYLPNTRLGTANEQPAVRRDAPMGDARSSDMSSDDAAAPASTVHNAPVSNAPGSNVPTRNLPDAGRKASNTLVVNPADRTGVRPGRDPFDDI